MEHKLLKKLLLIIFSILMFCLNATSTYANDVTHVQKTIVKHAKTMGVDPAIALSIAKTESGFNQSARSKGGHIGVFQLSYNTAKTMGFDPYKLDENIKAGITYYKNLYTKFGSTELALAAYNSGPYAVSRNNNKIPSNSRYFVSKIMTDYKYFKADKTLNL